MKISALVFVPLTYGFYTLGYYLSRTAEIYKGVEITSPPIPITLTFFISLSVAVAFVELIILIIGMVMENN